MDVVRGFEEKWGFPQCFGAVDGSHIPIIPPHDCPTDYFNRKGFHSIVLQALVDHENRFMNVNVGWPGSVHDARILSNSEVFLIEERQEHLYPNLCKFWLVCQFQWESQLVENSIIRYTFVLPNFCMRDKLINQSAVKLQ